MELKEVTDEMDRMVARLAEFSESPSGLWVKEHVEYLHRAAGDSGMCGVAEQVFARLGVPPRPSHQTDTPDLCVEHLSTVSELSKFKSLKPGGSRYYATVSRWDGSERQVFGNYLGDNAIWTNGGQALYVTQPYPSNTYDYGRNWAIGGSQAVFEAALNSARTWAERYETLLRMSPLEYKKEFADIATTASRMHGYIGATRKALVHLELAPRPHYRPITVTVSATLSTPADLDRLTMSSRSMVAVFPSATATNTRLVWEDEVALPFQAKDTTVCKCGAKKAVLRARVLEEVAARVGSGVDINLLATKPLRCDGPNCVNHGK